MQIKMINNNTGVIKTGFYGFSWTTLLFGFLPALFRQDWLTFLGGFAIYSVISISVAPLALFILPLLNFIWSFNYNKYYTCKLLERGYVFSNPREANVARATLGLVSVDSRQPIPQRVYPAGPITASDAQHSNSDTNSKRMKQCPQCAEDVLQAAKLCRFCRWEFSEEPARTPVDQITALASSQLLAASAFRRGQRETALFVPPTTPYQPGHRVTHVVLGEGCVERIDVLSGDIVVAFDRSKMTVPINRNSLSSALTATSYKPGQRVKHLKLGEGAVEKIDPIKKTLHVIFDGADQSMVIEHYHIQPVTPK